jgi:hypothetical protein
LPECYSQPAAAAEAETKQRAAPQHESTSLYVMECLLRHDKRALKQAVLAAPIAIVVLKANN